MVKCAYVAKFCSSMSKESVLQVYVLFSVVKGEDTEPEFSCHFLLEYGNTLFIKKVPTERFHSSFNSVCVYIYYDY